MKLEYAETLLCLSDAFGVPEYISGFAYWQVQERGFLIKIFCLPDGKMQLAVGRAFTAQFFPARQKISADSLRAIVANWHSRGVTRSTTMSWRIAQSWIKDEAE